jgi:hypothetical protein
VRDLASLTAASFEDVDGQYFEAQRMDEAEGAEGAETISLSLDRITRFGEPNAGGRQPFSLIFRGPASPALPQGIHHLTHPDLGPLEIFLVPIDPGGQGSAYEAVFT